MTHVDCGMSVCNLRTFCCALVACFLPLACDEVWWVFYKGSNTKLLFFLCMFSFSLTSCWHTLPGELQGLQYWASKPLEGWLSQREHTMRRYGINQNNRQSCTMANGILEYECFVISWFWIIFVKWYLSSSQKDQGTIQVCKSFGVNAKSFDPCVLCRLWITTITPAMLGHLTRMIQQLEQGWLGHQLVEMWWSSKSKWMKHQDKLLMPASRLSVVDLPLPHLLLVRLWKSQGHVAVLQVKML